jgi:hypothetical protein
MGDQDIDGRIILRWIFRKWNGGAWNELILLRIRTGGEYERSGSIKCGEFLD